MANVNKDLTKTDSLSPEMMKALCYAPLVGWVISIVLLLIKTSKEVKWNAVQGLLLSASVWAVGSALSYSIILAIFSPLVWVAGFVLELVLVIKVYQGEKVRLPILAPLADKIVSEKIK